MEDLIVLDALSTCFFIPDILTDGLPETCREDTATVLKIAVAWSARQDQRVLWTLVSDVPDGIFQLQHLERTVDSKPWLSDYGDAQWVRVPMKAPSPPPPQLPPGKFVAEANLEPS